MSTAKAKRTTSKRPAPARRRLSRIEREAERKITALLARIELKRDDMMRKGFARIVREMSDYDAGQRRLLLGKMLEFMERDGKILTVAMRRKTEKEAADAERRESKKGGET